MAKGSVRKKGKKWYYRFYVEDASGNLVQKEFTGTESNEGQRNIREKRGALHHGLWHQVQDKRSAEDSADDICRHVRQTKFFGHTGHQKPGGKH